ncbi:helix-turn-helix domain-containing protein [Mycobacteroides abscessus]|uniref:helix-turn-helix domain-containing protein n=1 Tax=Mycobacteroides abscessus TaxID=36809 RepID=UPI00092AC3B3|nr:helix-turn-helix transcriptional regulator [Mycobacteroides abscessus]SIE24334.1 putative transcriptional regulator with C-terminal CBS domains [Mycobacteroides abscessus subsp. abscessus]
MTSDDKLPNPIKERRENKRFTPAAIADMLGIGRSTYNRYESGQRKIPLPIARKMAELLDLSLEEIAGQAMPPEVSRTWTPDARSLATGHTIASRRRQLKISVSQVAHTAGIPIERYRRYEAGTEPLTLADASDLAEALDMSLAQMDGSAPKSVEFNGQWWAAWQGGPNGPSSIDPQTINILRAGNRLLIDEGWRGELEIFGTELLLGWYRPPSRAIRTRQGVFLWMPTGVEYAYGKWTGVSVNNTVASGWCVLARDEEQSLGLIKDLVDRNTQPRTPLLLPPFD